MENVTLFFCDICGTFDSGHTIKTNSDEIRRFIDNLNKLLILDKSNKILFCFVTTESLEIVKKWKIYLNKM